VPRRKGQAQALSLSSRKEQGLLPDTPIREEGETMFDISKLAAKDTAIVELDGPDGEPLENEKGERLSITVFGPGSKQFQKAQGVRNRAILDHVRKGGKKMKDDDQRELDAEFLASCTASFNNFVYKDMSGYDQFKSAYSDASIGFIAEQVNKAIGDWGNFT
jgi:hypothetical protein